jgi:hypothetical protein
MIIGIDLGASHSLGEVLTPATAVLLVMWLFAQWL